ncbi:hypothetical protein HMN09_01325400 [Mycena chlorophos]|uniref:Chromosome transmission fidelity protein 8 n=1 Tax=Mycena chlorophos TaxID=658473 RepID=A0A8H6S0G6_MYCCL|nr:hypothetical protein HMN09_01325400 [Mycena chlorophos]
MIIPISFNIGATGICPLPPALARISHSEVVLVELQGALEVDYVKPSERDGKLVGKLGLDNSGNTATLRIGHHLLEGRVTQLAKPLAVLQCIVGEQAGVADMDIDVPLDDEEDAASQQAPSETQTTTGWDAIALIKRKIVFSKRPTPIVGRPNV